MRPDPGSNLKKLLLIQDARVHYVVLKQQPHTTHPTHTTCMIGAAGKPETKAPDKNPNKGAPPGPVASGPNSVPNDHPATQPGRFPEQQPHKGEGSYSLTGPCHQAPIR